MLRTQIRLSDQQHARLRTEARRQGRSIAALVRESVSEYLARQEVVDREEPVRRALAAAGRFGSGVPDLAENHDRYLEEAFDS